MSSSPEKTLQRPKSPRTPDQSTRSAEHLQTVESLPQRKRKRIVYVAELQDSSLDDAISTSPCSPNLTQPRREKLVRATQKYQLSLESIKRKSCLRWSGLTEERKKMESQAGALYMGLMSALDMVAMDLIAHNLNYQYLLHRFVLPTSAATPVDNERYVCSTFFRITDCNQGLGTWDITVIVAPESSPESPATTTLHFTTMAEWTSGIAKVMSQCDPDALAPHSPFSPLMRLDILLIPKTDMSCVITEDEKKSGAYHDRVAESLYRAKNDEARRYNGGYVKG